MNNKLLVFGTLAAIAAAIAYLLRGRSGEVKDAAAAAEERLAPVADVVSEKIAPVADAVKDAAASVVDRAHAASEKLRSE